MAPAVAPQVTGDEGSPAMDEDEDEEQSREMDEDEDQLDEDEL